MSAFSNKAITDQLAELSDEDLAAFSDAALAAATAAATELRRRLLQSRTQPEPQASAPPLLTQDEACELLGGIDGTTLWRRIRKGQAPKPVYVGVGRGRPRWKVDELSAAVAAATQPRAV